MIEALDHLAIRGDAAAYETLLGRCFVDGRLQTRNVGLVFGAPVDTGGGTPLARIAFATASLATAKRLLGRRAVPTTRHGDLLEIDATASHGVPVALVERAARPAVSPSTGDEAAAVAELDHVVVRSPNPERAIAFYAGRLGLDLRLDRSNPEWGARLLFFRCDDLVVEIAHDLRKGVSDAPDTLWGLSWRADDIAAAQARLKRAGVAVSDVRPGRRPGTQIVAVSSHTGDVPTILIGGQRHW